MAVLNAIAMLRGESLHPSPGRYTIIVTSSERQVFKWSVGKMNIVDVADESHQRIGGRVCPPYAIYENLLWQKYYRLDPKMFKTLSGNTVFSIEV